MCFFCLFIFFFFFFSSRRRHTRCLSDWSSDVCSSDLWSCHLSVSSVPFLDHKLVEFTCRLPERLKLRGGTTKYILRESMKGVLPDRSEERRVGKEFRSGW